MSLLIDKNNITIPKGARTKDTQDQNNQPKRGHAIMDNVLKVGSLLIDLGALNHIFACKDSFTSLDSNNCIFIHMGDDSQVSSKGKGTIHLEHKLKKCCICALFRFKLVVCISNDTHSFF